MNLATRVAAGLHQLMAYPADPAGAPMDPRVTTFRPAASQQALASRGEACEAFGTPRLGSLPAVAGQSGNTGAAVPMLLTALRQDPGQSSSVILTTVTVVAGFMSFLGIATLLAGML